MTRLSFSEATQLAVQAFENLGVVATQAEMAAETLALAEAMGIATHGLSRVRVYAERIAAGGIDARAQIGVATPAAAVRLIDGANALGPAVAETARRAAAEAAKSCGIGAAFVRDSNHLGALAPFLYLSAEAGLASIVTTTTAPMIAPAGGRKSRVGNNPLGLAVPNPDGHHAMLDMALSVASRSRVRAAAKEGRTIPDSWATDAEGRPTTDPMRAMQGLMRAIGGDKGANLALALDLMVSVLSGAATLSEIGTAATEPDKAQKVGHLFVLIDATALLTEAERRERAKTSESILSSTPRLDPAVPVRLPGARALAALDDTHKYGLSLSPELLADLKARAEG